MDVIQTLKNEHQLVLGLLQRCAELDKQAATDQIVRQLQQELSAHEQAEEDAVYSQLRQAIPDVAVLDQAISEQGELKQLLRQLGTGGQDLSGQVERLTQLIKGHIDTEENKLFPLVQQHCDEQTRAKLSDDFMASKHHQTEQMAKLNVTIMPESKSGVQQPT